MSVRNYSEHRKNLISHYHANFDAIMLQKLSEPVTELYLADTDKKRRRLRQRVHMVTLNLEVPTAIAEDIIEKRNVEMSANNLRDWLDGRFL